jgi:prepilin-type N-terminal cleavage/methylation domain-containing protein
MRRAAGFTLVEIMLVVSIIALLAVMALPSFMRAREQARHAKFINALRIAIGAFEMYSIEHSAYPPDVNRGIVPAGMSLYFGPTLQWTGQTPIGGQWDWDYSQFGFTAGVSVVSSPATLAEMTDIDEKIDNGNLSSGHFQDTGTGRYTDIIE